MDSSETFLPHCKSLLEYTESKRANTHNKKDNTCVHVHLLHVINV